MSRYLWRVYFSKLSLLSLQQFASYSLFSYSSPGFPRQFLLLSLCFVSPYSLYLLSVSLILVVVVYHLSPLFSLPSLHLLRISSFLSELIFLFWFYNSGLNQWHLIILNINSIGNIEKQSSCFDIWIFLPFSCFFPFLRFLLCFFSSFFIWGSLWYSLEFDHFRLSGSVL